MAADRPFRRTCGAAPSAAGRLYLTASENEEARWLDLQVQLHPPPLAPRAHERRVIGARRVALLRVQPQVYVAAAGDACRGPAGTSIACAGAMSAESVLGLAAQLI